jgi:hypothetical protein
VRGKPLELHYLLTYLLTWLGYNPSTPPSRQLGASTAHGGQYMLAFVGCECSVKMMLQRPANLVQRYVRAQHGARCLVVQSCSTQL